MRYSGILRSSRKPNILHHNFRSTLISVSAMAIGLMLVLLFINVGHLSADRLLFGLWDSLIRVSIAYIIALLLACVLALLITANNSVENLLLPIFDVLQSFPSFALFPVLVQALENYPQAIIVLVLVITVIWPLLFSIIGGIKNQRLDLDEAATVFKASGFKRLRYFILPELFPVIVTGSIVGWGEAWEFIIGAELLVHVRSGVGSYLGQLGEAHQNALLAFGIIALMMFLFLLNKLIWLPLLRRSTLYQTES